MYVFLKEGHKNANEFSEEKFLIKYASLQICDIFDKLIALNTSLQGNNMHLLKSIEKMSDLIKKTQTIEKKNE
jgi:hypothetical protein